MNVALNPGRFRVVHFRLMEGPIVRRSFGATLLMMMFVMVWAAPIRAGDEAHSSIESGFDEWSEADRKILERGEYSPGRIAASGLLGTVVGFGMGHIVQGRFGSRGWIFATVEGGSLGVAGAAAVLTLAVADGDGAVAAACVALGGLGVFAIARLWEIGDVWAHPVVHNRRFRKLKERASDPKLSLQVTPRVGGGTVGLAVRF